MNKKVIIYGAGAQTRQFLSEVDRWGGPEFAALTVDREYLLDDRLFGLPVVAYDELGLLYPPEQFDMLVIGTPGRPKLREKMYLKAKEDGYSLINYISPDVYIGEKTVMGDNNIICSGTEIGYGGQLGSGNLIRQHVYIG